MRARALLVAFSLVLGLPAFAHAGTAPKPGAACTKKNAYVVVGALRYTCITKGATLVWSKGMPIAPTKAQWAREAALRNAQIAAGEFVTIPTRLLKPLEKWDGSDLADKAWSTTSLKGKPTVINIWASWCGPCKEEWPVLQQGAAEHPAVRFVGINSQDRLDQAREWLAANPSVYTHVYDERGVIKSSLTTVPSFALPITLVLNSKAEVAAWITGAIKIEPLRKVLRQIK